MEIFESCIAAALQRKQNTLTVCLFCGLAGEISRNCGSYSKAFGAKDFSVSLFKKIKWK